MQLCESHDQMCFPLRRLSVTVPHDERCSGTTRERALAVNSVTPSRSLILFPPESIVQTLHFCQRLLFSLLLWFHAKRYLNADTQAKAVGTGCVRVNPCGELLQMRPGKYPCTDGFSTLSQEEQQEPRFLQGFV